MLKKTYFLFTLLLLLSLFKANATHIVGGEIYYDKLGGNNYRIYLKVYRDCLNGIPPFDNPAVISIFNASGALVQNLTVSITSSITVPPSNNSPCAPTTAGNACVEEAIYTTGIVNLPPLTGGYTIAYQRCCRNGTILNLVNPGNVGATYWEHIPGPEVVAVNSSPRFTNRPPIYVCANVPISFNHIATDPDGDVLVYSLCDPFNGLDACCPIIPSNNAGCAPACPTNNTSTAPPPYIPVPFSAPYSASYPMASSPAININSSTGFLNGNPTIIGQWVVGVCVSEYRAGVLIGTHYRDFQFNVISCPFIVTAGIVSQQTSTAGQGGGTNLSYCNGMTVSFSNTSSLGTNYHWDFGDPNSLSDTSNIYNPTYTFPGPGDYTVSVIAAYGNPCADTAYEVFHIHPLLLPSFLQPASQCFNGNSFNFVAAGSYQGNGSVNWNFGNGATPLTANTVSVNNVTYGNTGIKTVSLTVAENGCTVTVSHTLEVAQNPIATIGNYITSGCAPLTFSIQNQSPTGPYITYLWTFSNGTTSNSISPTVTFTNAGVYTFTLSAMSNQVCIDTTDVAAVTSVTVVASPTAQFLVTPSLTQCFNGHTFGFVSTSIVNTTSPTYNWSFGLNANPTSASTASVSNVTYNNSGVYPVTLTVLENGCSNTSTLSVGIYPNPVAIIAPYPLKGCDPQTITFTSNSTSASPLTYLWSFSDGTTSTSSNPTHVFTPVGVYSLSLTVSTNSLCIGTSSVQSVSSITINPSPTAGFSIITDNLSEVICVDSSSTDVVSWFYDFDDGFSSTAQNPQHFYYEVDIYNIKQTVINEYGCPAYFNLDVMIIPDFGFYVPNTFTPSKNDGINDVFRPVVYGVEDYEFTIYDRWGALIFKTNNTVEGWNGDYKGSRCKMDVYVWKIEFKNKVTKQFENHIGHVTLL